MDFKNNISKYDNEIIELKRTLKDNKVKYKKVSLILYIYVNFEG